MAIKVSGTTVIDNNRNITNVGNIGDSNTVYFGNGSNLSGVESGTHEFVASGNIPNGTTVVVNTDGTVGIVTLTGSSNPGIGSTTQISSTGTPFTSSVYDPVNQKVVVLYRDTESYVVVGTVTGDSISFGSPVNVLDPVTVGASIRNMDYPVMTYAGSGKIVILWKSTANYHYIYSVAGIVSGNTISFGPYQSFEGSNTSTSQHQITYDPDNDKVIVAYRDATNNSGRVRLGTVYEAIDPNVPVSIDWQGNAHEFSDTDNVYATSLVYDPVNKKVVIAYVDSGSGSGGNGKSLVGTVLPDPSLTQNNFTMTFGPTTTFDTNITGNWIGGQISSVYDSFNNKIVLCYAKGSSADSGTAVVGTVDVDPYGIASRDNISFGSPSQWGSIDYNGSQYQIYFKSVYDSINRKVVIAFSSPSRFGAGIVGTVSGINTSISFGSAIQFTPTVWEINDIGITHDSSNNRVIISYEETDQQSNSNYYVKSTIFLSDSRTTNLTAENYIGIAGEAISDGATGKINVVTGINTGQSGLTTSKEYYVQRDGTLYTTTSHPSVVAGTSISSTEIIVK